MDGKPTMSQVKELIQKGIQKSLEEQQVPLHLHLKVVDALSKSMSRHQADLNMHKVEQLAHVKQMKTIEDQHTQERQALSNQIQSYRDEVSRLHTLPHIKGQNGYTPVKGVDYTDGKQGKPGVSPSLEDIVEAVKPHIPKPIPGKSGQSPKIDKQEFFKELVTYLKTEKPLDLSHIKGAQEFVMQTGQKNIKVKFEELMHGGGSGGGNTGTAVYNEVVSGSGTSWALTNIPTTGTLRLYANGQRLIPGSGNDYTLSGGNITTALSWSAGTLLADYSHS